MGRWWWEETSDYTPMTGDTGTVIYSGGVPNEMMMGTRKWDTGIVARGRIYYPADNKIYAFVTPGGVPTPTPRPTATLPATPTPIPTATPTSTPLVTPTPINTLSVSTAKTARRGGCPPGWHAQQLPRATRDPPLRTCGVAVPEGDGYNTSEIGTSD